MSKEAMKLALEALEWAEFLVESDERSCQDAKHSVDKAITALREALAEQPAQQGPDYKALYEKAAHQYNELAALMEKPALVMKELYECKSPVLSAGPITPEMEKWSEGDKVELISVITQHITAQPAQQKPDFASLLREAEEIVRKKPTWKRFIDGTSLSNDVPVWMTVFAQDVARRAPPPQRTWVGLTDEEILIISRDHYNPHQRAEVSFARAIEAALRSKNT